MIKVQVLSFGILKDKLGAAFTVELPQGASVATLLNHLRTHESTPFLQGIAVSVNAEYATAAQLLSDGDEVGLLPPVSGGSAFASPLTRDPIPAERLIADAKSAEDGAVVVFDGIVRNNSRGRRTLYLDYEAYEEMAEKQIHELTAHARARFGVRHAAIFHRLGRLEVGETSVLILVGSAHRAAAYEASRWLIDTLKKTVPIWKKEIFADGAVWADGEPFPPALAIDPEAKDAQ